MAKVNPVQTTTYSLNAGNNPITFGTGTDINVSSGTQTGVYGSNVQSWAVTNQGAISGALYGVELAGGGSVVNKAGATISGFSIHYAYRNSYRYTYLFGDGIRVAGSAGTVTNAGTISAGNDGVYLGAGGSVTNEAGAKIRAEAGASGYYSSVGIDVAGGAGTVTNAGDISGNGSSGFFFGVELQAGGSLTNKAGGTISGGFKGVVVAAGGSVTNSGTIGDGLDGVDLTAGGSVINEAGGTISGYYGVAAGGGAATVVNAGTILGVHAAYTGGEGIAGVFLGSGGSVTNEAGATISAHDGVDLAAGGSVTNEAGATIAAIRAGIRAFGVATVSNAGTISGTERHNIGYGGVGLYAGGSVINKAGGTITGPYCVYINGGAGMVTNAGDITGQDNSLGTTAGAFGGFWGGVFLGEGGSVTNRAGATISGFDFGVAAKGNAAAVMNTGDISGEVGVATESAATLTNSGAITGTKVGSQYFFDFGTIPLGDGVFMNGGGTVANNVGGTITGAGDGVYIAGGGAVTNAGSISGASASVQFAGVGANTLTLETGSTLTGDAIGSTASGATNALILQGHGTADNNFDNFNTLNVQANGNWTLGGDSTFGATTVSSGSLVVAGDVSGGATTLGDSGGDLGQLVIASTGAWDLLGDTGISLGGPAASLIKNSGLLEKTSGTGTSAIAPQLINKGSVVVSSGALDLEGAVSGNGADTVSGASTLEFDSTVGGGQTAGFTGGGGALDLTDPLGFAAKISGFAATDKVELSGDWVFSAFSESGNGMMGTLTLSSGSNDLALHFLGDYTATDFKIASGATTTISHA